MKRTIGMLAAVLLLTISVAGAEDAVSKGLVLKGDITSELADIAIKSAVTKAKADGTLMNIAVVDAGANLKAFYRMDGAFLGSIDIAQKKAFTSRAFNGPTANFAVAAQPGQELYGIEVTNGGMTIFGGGELLKDKDGVVIGAIGVSGGSVAEDIAVAQAGVAAVLEATK